MRNWRLLANNPQDNNSPYDTENIYYELTDTTLNFKYEYYEDWEDPYGNTIAMIHFDIDDNLLTGANGIGFAPEIIGIDVIVYSYGFGQGFDGDGVYIYDSVVTEFIRLDGIEWENRGFNTNEFSFGVLMDYFQNLNFVHLTIISAYFNQDSLDLIPNEGMLDLYFTPSWLSIDLETGIIAAGESLELDVTFGGEDLTNGNYNAIIEIDNNDPMLSKYDIPVSLNYFLNNAVYNIPNSFALYPAFPNPFNPVTTISYDLPKEEFDQIEIYNLKGNLIRSLINLK